MRKYKKWIILSLSIIIIGIISFYGFSIVQFGKDIQDPPSDRQSNESTGDKDQTEPPPEWEGTERVNILMLGVDARGAEFNDPPRSDTIMVLSVDPLTKQAHLFSILRDTYVNIPEFGMERMNTAYAVGGADLAMQTVSELLNIPIHFYVSVDFEGFIELVDAIGGIQFEVEKNMKYTDPTDLPEYNIDLKKGLQHLDGNKALQYVRFRHDRLSDFTRTERQRNLMNAVADKMLSFSSLVRLPFTLEKIEPYINTNMTIKQMWALGNLGKNLNSNGLIGDQLPPNSLLREEVIQGASVITVDPQQLQSYIQERFENKNSTSDETEAIQ
jgi:LCP family protein required for cell wall assembly